MAIGYAIGLTVIAVMLCHSVHSRRTTAVKEMPYFGVIFKDRGTYHNQYHYWAHTFSIVMPNFEPPSYATLHHMCSTNYTSIANHFCAQFDPIFLPFKVSYQNSRHLYVI